MENMAGGGVVVLLPAACMFLVLATTRFFPPVRPAMGADEREQHVDALMLFPGLPLRSHRAPTHRPTEPPNHRTTAPPATAATYVCAWTGVSVRYFSTSAAKLCK